MAAPGWYPDPSEPNRLRLWDGNTWTTQTDEQTAFTGPTGGSPGGQAPAPLLTAPTPTPKRRAAKRPSGRWLGAGVIVIAVALIVAVVWGAIGGTDKKKAVTQPVSALAITPAGCPNPVPVGASKIAVAYLQALNLGNPGWAAVSTAIYAAKGQSTLFDVKQQAAADGVFLQAVQSIKFPATAAPTVKRLMTSVTAYRNLLLSDAKDFRSYASPKQVAQRAKLAKDRAAAANALRVALHLPASTCGYYEP
jgi:hypothetical protein